MTWIREIVFPRRYPHVLVSDIFFLFSLDTGQYEPPQPSALDLELQASGVKMKQIQEAWDIDPNINPHRRSGGGIEDYLDAKTLQHLEKLKVIDPQPVDNRPASSSGKSYSTVQASSKGASSKGYTSAKNFSPPVSAALAHNALNDANMMGRNQPDYLELTNRVSCLSGSLFY